MMTRLHEADLINCVDLIILADHGMQELIAPAEVWSLLPSQLSLMTKDVCSCRVAKSTWATLWTLKAWEYLVGPWVG